MARPASVAVAVPVRVQSWSYWGKISNEYGWWLIGGGVALFLLICIGCIVLTGGDDDDGRGQKKSS